MKSGWKVRTHAPIRTASHSASAGARRVHLLQVLRLKERVGVLEGGVRLDEVLDELVILGRMAGVERVLSS